MKTGIQTKLLISFIQKDKIIDIVILTERRYVNKNKQDVYTNNVFLEDQLVKDALVELGLKTLRLSWDDDNFDWSSTKYILFRSSWDYFNRFPEFSNWLNKVSKLTKLLNSEEIIRWNIDKHYLLDLQKSGIHIAKTHFIEKNSSITLKELYQKLNWKETVLKPCIFGTARHTYRLNNSNIEAHEIIFKQLIENEAMMLQSFQCNIIEKGEVSMMVFNGEFTHAVLKTAKKGDFRVQDDFGGNVEKYIPTDEEIIFAKNTVNACKELPMYARVDIFTDNENQIALAELELIEPELWFRLFPQAAKVLAKAVKNKLNSFP